MERLSRIQQKRAELERLLGDHIEAVAEFDAASEARARHLREARTIHVTCMDERNTLACEAVGVPLGAVDRFASPGGKVNAETLVRLYGEQVRRARDAGKRVTLHLMPHLCGAETKAGCAAFATDEAAQRGFFSALAEELGAHESFRDVAVITTFFDTDTHGAHAFDGEPISEAAELAQVRLRWAKGKVRKGSTDHETRREHAGHRVYVGRYPRAWTARRNVAYHLHDGLARQELIDGIALAIRVMKLHSIADLEAHPIVIQLDQRVGGSAEPASVLTMDDAALLAALNASANLAGIRVELAPDDVLVVRTETDGATWRGRMLA